jgi:hypothetical protein
MKQRKIIEAWMSRGQAACVRSILRGEEGDWMRGKLAEMQAVVDGMPVTGETDGQGDAAMVGLHFFRGSADVWLTELDKGCPDDEPEDYQSQAFGLVDLGQGWGAEMGYVSVPEILGAGLELDLHWTPVTVGELRAKKERAA